MTAMPNMPQGRILAVDPGLWYAGVALFNMKQLVDAELVEFPHGRTDRNVGNAAAYIGRYCQKWSPVHACVVENQTTRHQRAQRGPQNDLLPLAATRGAIFACVEANERISVHYSTWASSRDKKALPVHVKSRLLPNEEALLESKRLLNNEHVIDAVGIGFWATARM